MKSMFGIDYEAGYLGEVPKDIQKSFKKGKIKLSKKAYIVFPYDEKGHPAFFIVIDGDKAYMVLDDGTYELKRAGEFKADDLILISTDDMVDIVALEADAEYFKLTPPDAPNVIALGFIHEELGLRHAVIPLADMFEITGEEKDKFITDVKKTLQEEGRDIGFEPGDFKVAFIGIPVEELMGEAEEGETEEYEEYFPDDEEPAEESEDEEA